jgi:hypothetical protein
MRRWIVMAGVGLVGALLAGCAGAGGSADGMTGGPSSSVPPSSVPSSSGVPSGLTPSGRAPSAGPSGSLQAWADAALPKNHLGGSQAVTRQLGVVGPGQDFGADIGQDDGAWTVRLACESAGGAPLTYRIASGPDELAAGEAACAVPGQPGTGATTIDFAGGVDARLELSADESTTFVFEVWPAAGIEN